MARKKRPYVPKVKGCYECSQRRIDCDGTRPTCAKCNNRGIGCSGFGLKYKFLDGFSSRRKSSMGGRGALLKDALAQSSAEASVRAKPSRYQQAVDRKSGTQSSWNEIYWNSSAHAHDEVDQRGGAVDDYTKTTSADNDDASKDKNSEMRDVDDQYDNFSGQVDEAFDQLSTDGWLLSPTDLPLLEPWKEFLLSHSIAPEMVVIDDCYNGWRHLILPTAWSNDMVMDAVLAVSAFHVSGRATGQPVINPDRLYAHAISQLSDRKNLAGWNSETRQLVILVIVVLLVSVMVNGLPDFPIVFQMLESAIDAVGGDEVLAEGGEMGGFLLRQIRKSVKLLVSYCCSVSTNKVFWLIVGILGCGCMLHHWSVKTPESTLSCTMLRKASTASGIRQHAFNMYLRRVLPDDSEVKPTASSDELIKSFRKSLESFPEGTLGEHILIWPTFIAALECRNQEQRLFFERFLLRQYHRNRFMNIPKALEFLRGVWLQDRVQVNWPVFIPELRVFIM
ncbi:hypothetical protein CI238_11669 [Colletotrichum incanum]|uniref:Zn(2)-C6 fungal-type domain-containing protein n=1 Tax=Colletotrichum incanum TaxID=1573173 RepID=A0A167BF36_COLIC|nr:hypothetical protein CI238_11669 [Colletotrichum incanum]